MVDNFLNTIHVNVADFYRQIHFDKLGGFSEISSTTYIHTRSTINLRNILYMIYPLVNEHNIKNITVLSVHKS